MKTRGTAEVNDVQGARNSCRDLHRLCGNVRRGVRQIRHLGQDDFKDRLTRLFLDSDRRVRFTECRVAEGFLISHQGRYLQPSISFSLLCKSLPATAGGGGGAGGGANIFWSGNSSRSARSRSHAPCRFESHR